MALKFNPVVYEVVDEDRDQVLGDIVMENGEYVFQTQEGWQFDAVQLQHLANYVSSMNSGVKECVSGGYEEKGWIEWVDGNQVPLGYHVDVKLRCGEVMRGFAKSFYWPTAGDCSSDIVAYRIVEEKA